MKIAVPHHAGEVFQHFGKTPEFKIFNILNGKIITTSIIQTGTAGHSELGKLLSDLGVEVLICGGIGVGAINFLKTYNIDVLAGAYGDVDELINDYLNGSLTLSSKSNCTHHEHECHNHDDEHCCH